MSDAEADGGLDRTPVLAIPAGLDATLVLVRHGETEYIVEGRFQGQAPTPLSALGREQVARAGAAIASGADRGLAVPAALPIEIVHSPLPRGVETADAIGRGFANAGRPVPPLRADPGLSELGQGSWEGLRGAEVEAGWPELLAAWRSDPTTAWAPGGESLVDGDRRVRPTLAGVLDRLAVGRAGGPVDRPQVAGYGRPIPPDQPWSILVGHDGIFKIALLALLDLPLTAFWRFPFVLGGITIVEVRGGRPVLRAHNLADHLADSPEALADTAERAAAEPAVEAIAETRARERSGAL